MIEALKILKQLYLFFREENKGLFIFLIILVIVSFSVNFINRLNDSQNIESLQKQINFLRKSQISQNKRLSKQVDTNYYFTVSFQKLALKAFDSLDIENRKQNAHIRATENKLNIIQENQGITERRLFEQIDNSRKESELVLNQRLRPVIPNLEQPEIQKVIYVERHKAYIDTIQKKKFNPFKILSKIL